MFIKSDICGAEEAQTVSVFNSLLLIERAEKAMFNVTKCKEGSDHNFIVYSYTDLGLILMLITVTASETKILARAITHDPHNLGNNKDLEEDVGHDSPEIEPICFERVFQILLQIDAFRLLNIFQGYLTDNGGMGWR